MPGDVVCGGMRLPRAERVVHVDICQAGKLERETFPELSFGLLPLEPPHIRKIDASDPPFSQFSYGQVNGCVDPYYTFLRIQGKFRNVKFCMELLFKVAYDRFNGLFRSAGYCSRLSVFGPAYMGHHDWPAASFHEVKERPYGTVNPVGVPYFSSLHYIMIKPDEDDFPFEVGVLNQRQFRM